MFATTHQIPAPATADANSDAKPTVHIDAGLSNQTRSTLVTLGKRQREDSDRPNVRNVRPKLSNLRLEQQAVSEDAQSENGESPQLAVSTGVSRAVKSAPTSANGSNNLMPQLDIQVKLPADDESSQSDDEDNSVLSKEKR